MEGDGGHSLKLHTFGITAQRHFDQTSFFHGLHDGLKHLVPDWSVTEG